VNKTCFSKLHRFSPQINESNLYG